MTSVPDTTSRINCESCFMFSVCDLTSHISWIGMCNTDDEHVWVPSLACPLIRQDLDECKRLIDKLKGEGR